MGDTDSNRREPTDASDGTDVDPTQLQRQLSEIKGAMGLEEQYPGQRRLWLVYGIVVGLASLLAEAIFVVSPDWSGSAYLGIWVAYALITGFSLMRLASGMPREDAPAAAPDWRVLFGTLVLAFVATVLQAEPVLSAAEAGLADPEFARLEGAFAYSLIISISGIGFLFAGNGLRAYRVRTRDRRVFYAAGVWMLGFAVAFTQIAWLRPFGYAVFGVLFLAYSLGAYVVLGRSDDAHAT